MGSEKKKRGGGETKRKNPQKIAMFFQQRIAFKHLPRIMGKQYYFILLLVLVGTEYSVKLLNVRNWTRTRLAHCNASGSQWQRLLPRLQCHRGNAPARQYKYPLRRRTACRTRTIDTKITKMAPSMLLVDEVEP